MAESVDVATHLMYIREGIDAINERLDTLNGRTRSLETKVAVVESTIERRKPPPAPRGFSTKDMSTGKLVAAFVAVLIALAGALEAVEFVFRAIGEAMR